MSFIVIFLVFIFLVKKSLNVGPPLGLINVRKKERSFYVSAWISGISYTIQKAV